MTYQGHKVSKLKNDYTEISHVYLGLVQRENTESCSSDPTTNSETKNLNFLENKQDKRHKNQHTNVIYE